MKLNMLRNMRWRVLILAAGVAVVLIFEIARYTFKASLIEQEEAMVLMKIRVNLN